MESAEHAGPGVPAPPSLEKPRMGGECLTATHPRLLPPNNPEIHEAQLPFSSPSPGEGPAWTKPRGTWIQMTHPH